ncbi:DNA-binding response regulator, OmpR family, contains REC and winged-helix (wHTH) domain [Hymenobacter gelipurpurascens]|uniref:DNA-binding response regulator, OmpR family, contains REC and winged-helix (WHTH) domain n=1 Tax=Hymenobacter gelipurpurascens TaxID=89968 RepID=A0A212TIF3_9BACT|nr:response regulator transcription factor [Hymenobacter gelipurpurascens]SNC65792.1 DNA-binding response regulator, OmpR family, contains REC and winged-helix (wHTH) domain [Hymenobacter gelipurpurascens]
MKILLVEDEPKVSAFIKRGLEEEGMEVEVAYDGRFGQQLALSRAYDLIILDVILPHFSGLEVLRAIRTQNQQTPVLMLTALGTTQDKLHGFGGGADDYLVKPFDFPELVARVHALTRRRGQQVKSAVLTFDDLTLDTAAKTVARAGQTIKLTAREFGLLELFLRHPGRVLSRAEIAGDVWEDSFDAGSNVVDVYVNYLRNKVDKGFAQKLIHTVVGMGYVLRHQ